MIIEVVCSECVASVTCKFCCYCYCYFYCYLTGYDDDECVLSWRVRFEWRSIILPPRSFILKFIYYCFIFPFLSSFYFIFSCLKLFFFIFHFFIFRFSWTKNFPYRTDVRASRGGGGRAPTRSRSAHPPKRPEGLTSLFSSVAPVTHFFFPIVTNFFRLYVWTIFINFNVFIV